MLNLENRLGGFGLSEHVLWWGGWHLLYALLICLVVSVVLGTLVGFWSIAVGVIVGLGWWFAGTRFVNANQGPVMREYGGYTEQVAQARLDTVGEATNSYTLTYASGNAALVEPREDYFSTTLVVGDSSVSIHRGVGIEMPSRIPYLRDNTREVFYDQITSVSYDKPTLKIGTSDGDTLTYKSSRAPDDALNDLQNRVRSYKTA